jgi:hypothetical protein
MALVERKLCGERLAKERLGMRYDLIDQVTGKP